MLVLFGSFCDCLQGIVIWKIEILVLQKSKIKSNFSSKCDFKSDEDKNKHSIGPCEGIVKCRHTLLVTSERSKRSSYWQSYKGTLNDIQSALKPL